MKIQVKEWLGSLRVAGRPDEYEVKQLVALFGIKVPRSFRLLTADELSSVDIDGPYVVKVCSPDILHKTDLGGVRVGVAKGELKPVVDEMFTRFEGAPILVEEMVKYQGHEIILGSLVDPSFGPAVMLGAGGVLTELLNDVSFRLVPCPTDEALRMIDELTVAPLFKGYRGFELDADSLAQSVSAVGELVESLGESFSQLDINPLVTSESGWVALDAKLVLK